MSLKVNDMILDRVRSVSFRNLTTDKIIFLAKQIEDPSLKCTAEGEEVTDAIGSTITTLYRAKKASFDATASLFSMDIAAAQYGTTKSVATSEAKITQEYDEIITIPVVEGTAATSVKTKYVPTNTVKWIYSVEEGGLGTAYAAGAAASATEFVIANDGTITLPTGLTGKIYVEYQYASTQAVKVSNQADKFPETGKAVISVYFRDKCDDNKILSGKIVCPKAKINPESIEHALTSTGKHPFAMNIQRDYCDESAELYYIVVSDGEPTT